MTGFVVDTVDEAILAVGRLASLDRHAIRKRFLERFSIGRTSDDYVELYDDIIGVPAMTAAPLAMRRGPVAESSARATAAFTYDRLTHVTD